MTRSYTENAPIPVFVFDRECHIVEINPAALELLGFDDSAMAHRSLPNLIPADDYAALLRKFADIPDVG